MIVKVHVVRSQAERPVPWGLSLVAHGGLLLWLLWPEGAMKRPPSAYEQLIKGKEDKIVVYQFKKKLPDVKPLKAADARPPRAETVEKQSIVSSPKNAPKERQMVWMAAPEMKEPLKMDLPNLIALQKTPLPAPERKKFVPGPVQVKPVREAQRPMVAEAPVVSAVQPVAVSAWANLVALPQPSRLKYKPAAAKVEMKVAQVQEAGAPPTAAFAASGASLSELNVAVVGLNPPAKDAKLPEGSRAAEFSAGPKLNPDGGTGKGNPNAQATLPDLVVNGGGQDAKATLLAMSRPVAPTSAEALRGMSKYAAPSSSLPPRASAARVSSAPNQKFEGREVYSMAIQMPNITSYFGSWLMWYADRSVSNAGPLAPPVAHRKVDPKYIASAVSERVEGRVQLMCVINRTGRVDQVELVRGIDPRLDQSAMDALAKWEFTPASRKGEPVDVDVMVEIPFKLAPRTEK